MRIREFLTCLTIALFALAIVPVTAGEGEHQMSPEEQAMMEKWQAYMTPGEPHAFLAKMVGEWEITTKMWQAPGTDPEESKGTAKMKMIMDGRYILEKLEGSFQDQPFQGMGITGYDNMKGKFVSVWLDSMGTGIMTSEGTCDGDACTYFGEAPDVVTGKYKRVKMIGRHPSDDEMIFEMYDKGPGGEEFMSFRIRYRRAES